MLAGEKVGRKIRAGKGTKGSMKLLQEVREHLHAKLGAQRYFFARFHEHC